MSVVSLTVGKVDAGVTVLLTEDKRLIEFPSILLPPGISSGSIVDIAVSRNISAESRAANSFAALQDRIFAAFGASEPAVPMLRCRNATQTSVVLEWDPIRLATADLLSLSLYRNGQKAGAIPRPLSMTSTKISGLAVDTEYAFHLVLRTSAGSYASERVVVRTHKMTDLSGVTVTAGVLPSGAREELAHAVARIGARMADDVRIDTTHFVTTEGRGVAWERAVEMNIPVVRPEWVGACERSGRILGVTKFYLDAVLPVDDGSFSRQQQQSQPQQSQSQQPQPPRPQKELPERPAEPHEQEGGQGGQGGDEERAESRTQGGSAPSPSVSPAASPAVARELDSQKVLAVQDEQKTRLEERRRKVPEGLRAAVEDGSDDEGEKKGASTDGASFQDVAL